MIDEKRIINNLEAFSFPRLSGTEGENKAFTLALSILKNLGLDPVVQEFTFSTFFSRVYQKIVFSLGFVLLFILFLNIEAVFFFYSVIIIFIIIIILIVITRNPEKINFGRILNSIKDKKKTILLTGLMPTGKFHIGHMLLIKQIIFWQTKAKKWK